MNPELRNRLEIPQQQESPKKQKDKGIFDVIKPKSLDLDSSKTDIWSKISKTLSIDENDLQSYNNFVDWFENFYQNHPENAIQITQVCFDNMQLFDINSFDKVLLAFDFLDWFSDSILSKFTSKPWKFADKFKQYCDENQNLKINEEKPLLMSSDLTKELRSKLDNHEYINNLAIKAIDYMMDKYWAQHKQEYESIVKQNQDVLVKQWYSTDQVDSLSKILAFNTLLTKYPDLYKQVVADTQNYEAFKQWYDSLPDSIKELQSGSVQNFLQTNIPGKEVKLQNIDSPKAKQDLIYIWIHNFPELIEQLAHKYWISVDEFKNIFQTWKQLPQEQAKKYQEMSVAVQEAVKIKMQDFYSSRLKMVALGWIFNYTQNIFDITAFSDSNKLKDNLDFDFSKTDVNPQNFSLQRKFMYKNTPFDIKFDSQGKINFTNYANSADNASSYSISSDYVANDIFDGISLTQVLDNLPRNIDFQDISDVSQLWNIFSTLDTMISQKMDEFLSSKGAEIKNWQREMTWEIQRQIVIKRFIELYRPPMKQYLYGTDCTVTRDTNSDFYQFLYVFDKWTRYLKTPEISQIYNILQNPKFVKFLEKQWKTEGTMPLFQRYQFFTGQGANVKLNISNLEKLNEVINQPYELDSEKMKELLENLSSNI